MDSHEWNKIFGAVLFALLAAVGLSIFSEIIFHREAPETPAYVIASFTEDDATEEADASESPTIGVLLASADAGAGEAAAKKCIACHGFDEGGANKVGPNLWDTVANAIGARDGYNYSDAMIAYAETAGDWSYENLDAYLADPAGTVPKTKMAFAGLKNDAERANVIAYLRSLSANPAPLPGPVAMAATEAGEATATAEEPMAEEATNAAETPASEDAAETTEMAATEETEAPASEEPAMAAAEPEASEESAPAEEQQMAAVEEDAVVSEEPQMAAAEGAAPAADEQMAAAEQTEAAETEAPAAEEVQMAAAEDPAAEGDVAAGEKFAKRCIACHTFDEGGKSKVGPPLYGILNRAIASVEGYKYSSGMVEYSEEMTKVWDMAALDAYLADPRGVVKGTKMVFPPVKDADRANILAYLATLQ